jgi:hypothetical protein
MKGIREALMVIRKSMDMGPGLRGAATMQAAKKPNQADERKTYGWQTFWISGDMFEPN